MSSVLSCKFCNFPPVYAPIDEMEKFDVKIYFCYPCQAEYIYFNSYRLASISLYTDVNNKKYRWTMPVAGYKQLWLIKDPGVPGTRKNNNLELIRSFKDDMYEITPINIQEKIKIWLLML